MLDQKDKVRFNAVEPDPGVKARLVIQRLRRETSELKGQSPKLSRTAARKKLTVGEGPCAGMTLWVASFSRLESPGTYLRESGNMIDWTDDRIAALSDSDLKNLLANAERKSVSDLIARCQAEVEKRNALKPRKPAKPRTDLKDFEHDVSTQLAGVGRRMAEKYDLSEETAKARSAGVKGFRAHKLVGSDGQAKLGGLQRAGFVAVDRYISYRRGNDIVSLGVFLPKDHDISERKFFVIAPQAMLDSGEPIDAIRDNHGQKQSADSGRMFDDLESATAVFDKVLARIAA